MQDQIEALKVYFDVEECGAEVHLYCKVCGRGWALPKEPQQIGSILRLLDHARSHRRVVTKASAKRRR